MAHEIARVALQVAVDGGRCERSAQSRSVQPACATCKVGERERRRRIESSDKPAREADLPARCDLSVIDWRSEGLKD